jgi:hypothetical protein
MEKCAVWAQSPRRTTLPSCHRALRTVMNVVHSARPAASCRFSSGWPPRCRAKIRLSSARHAASSMPSKPSPRQVFSEHSTITVLASPLKL